MERLKRGKKRGFVLLATAASVIVLVGMLGLAVDLGRVYIVKSESQAFADMASLAAARELDGSSTGTTSATDQVTNLGGGGSVSSALTDRWNFGTQSFGTANGTGSITTVEFAKCEKPDGTLTTCSAQVCNATGWTKTPGTPYTDYGCVRVTAKPAVNLAFMPYLGTGYTQTVTGQAIGAVVPETFPAGGYLPYTPFAHQLNCTSLGPPAVPTGCDTTGNFGYSVGQEYAFRWPGNLNSKGKACAGDQVNWPNYNFSDQVAGSDRGYFEFTSAATIADAILGEVQTMALAVGDSLNMTGGNKQAEAAALNLRTSYDTNLTNYANSATPPGPAAAYPTDTPPGNGMREVIMPVNSGAPSYIVQGFASFLLYTNYAVGSGDKPWCAIYMGSKTGGGSDGVFNVAGAFVVRLMQ